MPIGAILGGALAGGGALFGALTGANAATTAASQQEQAAQQALAFQQAIYGDTTANLAPYLGAGTNALTALASGLGVTPGGGLNLGAYFLQNPQAQFGAPPTLGTLPTYGPTAGQFQASPGYQWQLGQGINAIQNAATGPQGTLSGNMLKAAGTYGTGLANQDYYNWINQIYNPTYQSQLQNVLLPYQAASGTYWQNVGQATTAQQNALAALSALSGAGQNAAVKQGGFGQQLGANASNLITGAGAVRAAGTVGASNALTGGVNSLLTYLLSSPQTGSTNLSNIGNSLYNLFGGGGYGTAGTDLVTQQSNPNAAPLANLFGIQTAPSY